MKGFSFKAITIKPTNSTYACSLNITQRRKGAEFQCFGGFATWLYQARNDCGLLRIGQSTQRKQRIFYILNIALQ